MSIQTNISVVVITFNEEANLNRCLKSVRDVADEIIVLDSNSTDNTKAIAQQYNAKIYTQEFKGYGVQKNDANSFASFEWILSLDADEALSAELIAEIKKWKMHPPQHQAYLFSRLNNYLGTWLKYGGWYPDKKIRLFHIQAGEWTNLSVHEYWQPKETTSIGTMKGDILHYTYTTIAQHMKKIEQYSELSAIYAISKGKQMSFIKAMLGFIWFFIHKYFIRLGFLDGKMGYFACKMAAFEKWLKYQKIYWYNKNPNL
jgi:glycosyltransferase involved in cell wall biosynthesis